MRHLVSATGGHLLSKHRTLLGSTNCDWLCSQYNSYYENFTYSNCPGVLLRRCRR